MKRYISMPDTYRIQIYISRNTVLSEYHMYAEFVIALLSCSYLYISVVRTVYVLTKIKNNQNIDNDIH